MRTSKQSGFAMLEALVTAVIVAIGISGVGVLLLRSVQATQDSAQKSQGIWIVQDFAGRLRANSTGARSGAYTGVTSVANCPLVPTMCASYNNDGNNIEVVASCSADDMAIYDSWITVCELDDLRFDTPSDFIANPILNSNCEITDASNNCVQYSVTFTWDTKLTKGGNAADLGVRTNTNDISILVEVN
jgi:type IV pilus modification protein PilV